jgi:hypothetical protein
MKKYIDTLNIFNRISATTIFSAVLGHYGELRLPDNIFDDLLTEEQTFPNDFVTKNVAMFVMRHDQSSGEFIFEPRYPSEGNLRDQLGYLCVRGTTEVGHVDYDSPYYKK